MEHGHCLHPDASELDTAPLKLARVAVTQTGVELWRCAICAGWFVRVPQGELLDARSPSGADAFVRHFRAWIAAEAARRRIRPDEVLAAVVGPREEPPRVVVRPAPPPEALSRARVLARHFSRIGLLAVVTDADLEELARVVAEAGPWSLPSLLASLPDETLARRRVVAPARAIGVVDPWDIADRVNEDTADASISFVLVPAGDAGDLLPVPKSRLAELAALEALRGEDRRRLARLAAKTKA